MICLCVSRIALISSVWQTVAFMICQCKRLMQFCPQKIEWPPFILIIYVDMWFENSSLLQKGKYDYFRIIDNVFKRYELDKIKIYKYFWR